MPYTNYFSKNMNYYMPFPYAWVVTAVFQRNDWHLRRHTDDNNCYWHYTIREEQNGYKLKMILSQFLLKAC